MLAAAEIGDLDSVGHIRRGHISMSFDRMMRNAPRPRGPQPREAEPSLSCRFAPRGVRRPPRPRPARAMEAKGVEVLVVSDPSNMAWLTGYDGWSFYVHQAVVVPPDGEPVWFGRGQDANGARRTAWIGDGDIVGYPDHYVQSTERHPMD